MHRTAITLDFDAISLWISRNLTTPGPVSRGEFGAYAMPRILDTLRRYEVRATFFVPGHTVDTYPEICRRIRDEGHEIGAHGYAHELVSTMTPEEEEQATAKALESFRRELDLKPRGMRTPSWDFSMATTQILLDHGFDYDSSLMGQDYQAYFLREPRPVSGTEAFVPGKEVDVVEIPVSWSLDDHPQVEFLRTPSGVQPGPKTPREMFEMFFDDFDYMRQIEPTGFHMITLHPQVIGRGQRMKAFEEYLQRLNQNDAEFITCSEIADAFRHDYEG